MFSGFFAIIHLKNQPFADDKDDNLQACSLLSSVLTLWSATITVPSLHYHCTITVPSLCHHRTRSAALVAPVAPLQTLPGVAMAFAWAAAAASCLLTTLSWVTRKSRSGMLPKTALRSARTPLCWSVHRASERAGRVNVKPFRESLYLYFRPADELLDAVQAVLDRIHRPQWLHQLRYG